MLARLYLAYVEFTDQWGPGGGRLGGPGGTRPFPGVCDVYISLLACNLHLKENDVPNQGVVSEDVPSSKDAAKKKSKLEKSATLTVVDDKWRVNSNPMSPTILTTSLSNPEQDRALHMSPKSTEALFVDVTGVDIVPPRL